MGWDPAVLRIRIQGSSGSGFGIRIQGLKKWSKMFNNHNIILVFIITFTKLQHSIFFRCENIIIMKYY